MSDVGFPEPPEHEVVYEFGTEDGIDFLVMELLTGVSLAVKLAGRALPEKEVLRLGSQLADGLEAAHAQGIIHRDLKPGNLQIAKDDRLKILGFGLAHWIPTGGRDHLALTLTKSQEIGTLPCMAPEQLRGQPADQRTDIYAAGAVLYEMATGMCSRIAEMSGRPSVWQCGRMPNDPSARTRRPKGIYLIDNTAL